MIGTVWFGINNRYSVYAEGVLCECTLKGKRLDTGVREYTALSPGDSVEFTPLAGDRHHGVVVRRLERNSEFARWNTKRNCTQVFAANINLVVCVASVSEPPFRHRFIDRVLVSAEWFGVESLVVVNKADLPIEGETLQYLASLEGAGYRVLLTSALTGTGIETLGKQLAARRCVMVGQSGVGKSSLINVLVPDANLKVAEISRKYGKGVHTTRFGRLIATPDEGWIVDIPGIREIELVPEIANVLGECFIEFAPYIDDCRLPDCTHTHEPECGVIDAVAEGSVAAGRYESYYTLSEAFSHRHAAGSL